MPSLLKAILIAVIAHKGQKDKAGKAYIMHPVRVMVSLETVMEKIVAVLHDVLEDSNWTKEDLRVWGFSEEIVGIIVALTRRHSERYFDYIERLSQHPITTRVKLADLRDNMNLKRIKNPSGEDFLRMKKYQKAILILLKTYQGGKS